MNTKGGQLIGELSKVQILLEGHKILKHYLVMSKKLGDFLQNFMAF